MAPKDNDSNSDSYESSQNEDLDPTGRDADFSDLNASAQSNSAEGQTGNVAELKAQVAEFKDKYLRALAESENYKKRALRDRADLLKYQGDKIFQDILPILDNLELALQHADAEPEKLRSGVQLIHKMFVDILSRWGVKGDSSVGQEFNPAFHSALSRVPTPGAKAGTIVNELRKSYFYKDKLIRPAEVVVASEAEPSSDSEPKAEV